MSEFRIRRADPTLPTGGQHGTMTANVIKAVLLSNQPTSLEIYNRSGSADIYFTVNGTNPTVGGTGTFVVPGVAGAKYTLKIPNVWDATPSSVLRVLMISSSTPTYSVIPTY